MKKITQSLLVSLVIIISASTISAQDYLDAFKIGSSQHDEAYCCYEDTQGNIYLSGNFEGIVDFDPGSGEALITGMTSYDGYLAKYGADWTYIWAIGIIGNDQVNGKKIVVDADGNTYMAGYFRGEADFDPSENEYLIEAEEMDGFLAKYDTDGNFVWAFKIGSPESDIAFDVCFDNVGNIWVSGTFNAPVDFDPSAGTFILNDHGFMDAFMAKYSPDGSFIWAGGFGDEMSLFYQPTMICDNEGNLYVSSQFSNGADLDPGTGTYFVESAGGSDILMLKLDANNNFEWGFSMGGESQDQVRDIHYSDGLILITGFYEATIDFDPSSGEAILTSEEDYDAFVAAYGTDGTFTWVKPIVGTDPTQGQSLTTDEENNVYFTGSFYGTSDFDPSAATYELTAQGDWDIFTAKYDDDGNFQWANHAGGNENDYGQHILVSGDQDKVLVCGKFKGWAEFDHLGTGHVLNANGGFDAFLAAYTTYGGAAIHEVNSGLENIFFYPNPARGILNIDNHQADSNIQYSITNLLGLQVTSSLLDKGINSIDVSAYPAGIYFIRLDNGLTSLIRKVMIE